MSDSSYSASLDFAIKMDDMDPLARFRDSFIQPRVGDKPYIYFCGNSLGLQPKSTTSFLNNILSTWAEMGVEGFRYGHPAWMTYQQQLSDLLSGIVGAHANEVTAMNSLTINLHLLLHSFYRPREGRTKIMMEAGSFSSDRYAVLSFLAQHGLNETHLIELSPRDGATCLQTDDILEAINQHAPQLQMVLLSGVQYYTGQFFDIPAITYAAHRAGAIAGWDLAHAVGNVPLQLHDWLVDFAVWCHYKYLNGGPGAVGGAFVHQIHHSTPALQRLAGWWGNAAGNRFAMQPDFIPEAGVDGWHVSTPNMLSLAAVQAGLRITNEAGMEAIRKKSLQLTGYLEYLLNHPAFKGKLQILTPSDENQRGAQLSVYFKENAEGIQQRLKQAGFITDYRSPGVVRVAPAPLYNTFTDVYYFFETIRAVL
jgi:kynureninase